MAYTSTLTKLSENLKLTYENTIFSHSWNIGDSREKVVIDYLCKVMAHKYWFQSGEVFDENDNNSGQVDVIMYDNIFSTVFTDGTDKIMAPIESTYGIISVKSKMWVRELDNAIEWIIKYNSLKRPTVDNTTLQIMPDFAFRSWNGIEFNSIFWQSSINCIFAFETTVSTETIIRKVKECGVIDLLVIPNKLCLIWRSREEFKVSNNWEVINNSAIITDNSVSLFILFLQVLLPKYRIKSREVDKLLLDVIRSSEIEQII